MESFVCTNPGILQDATGFGFKSWLFALAFLLLGWSAQLTIWINSKFSRTSLASKRPWLGALFGTLIFLMLGNLIIKDGNAKMQALESGEYNTHQGYVVKIDKYYSPLSLNLAVNNIDIYLSGTVTRTNGKTTSLKGDEFLQKVTTQNGFVGVAGKSCSGQTCGLKIGDKVRIKTTNYLGHPLLIEKCEPN